MEEWFWKFPNLPQVPDDLVNLAYKSITDTQRDPLNIHYKSNDEEVFTQNGQIKKSVAFVQFLLDQKIVDWIHENIVDENAHSNLRIARSTIDPNGDEKHKVAHTDYSRDFILMYLLENGGPNHRTVFYQEKDKPLVRERHTVVYDYSTLNEIDSIQIPLKRWILLKTQIIHAVENIPNHRISFQLGIKNINGIKAPL